MATASVLLPIPPSGADPTNPPGMRFEDHRWELLFDDSTDELCYWTFRLPQSYASAPVLKVQHKATTATTGDVGFDASIMAVTPGDAADVDTPSFDTDNVSAGNTTPGTAGYLDETSITLTNADSMAAGDLVTIRLNRNTAVASDLTGDVEVVAVALEFTVT